MIIKVTMNDMSIGESSLTPSAARSTRTGKRMNSDILNTKAMKGLSDESTNQLMIARAKSMSSASVRNRDTVVLRIYRIDAN